MKLMPVTNNAPVGGFAIKGGTINPSLVLVGEYTTTELGSYPKRMNILEYQKMNNNTYLDLKFLKALFSSMKIGPSQFKLDEGLYFSVSPLGNSRFDRLDLSIHNHEFVEENSIDSSTMQEIIDWCQSQGFSIGANSLKADVVRVLNTVYGETENPLVSYSSLISAENNPGGVDDIKISEEVFNMWRLIQNDRFMKILPTNTNLGNHVILTQYREIIPSNSPLLAIPNLETTSARYDQISSQLAETTAFYREIKVRVKYLKDGRYFMSSHNLFIENYNSTNMVFSNSVDNYIQVAATNVSQGDQDPVFAVKITWDKRTIEHALITDLVMYDNGINQI